MYYQATKYSGEIVETPFIQRPLRPAASGFPIVGKGKHRATRYDRRKERDRLVKFHDAVAFAYAVDLPLNFGLTLSWSALLMAGEHNDGHCLGKSAWEREKYARDELARLCRTGGFPFVALWGRDVGKDLGDHVHFSLFWPSYKLAKFVAVIERITGSSAEFVLAPYAADIVARSVCGGWQINMNCRTDAKASALEWADYIAGQHAKHPAPPEIKGKAFGISEAIGKAAQERARSLLEAREAKYGWDGSLDGQQPPAASISPLKEHKGAGNDEDRKRQGA